MNIRHGRNEQGFTLVELMIAIGVLAILTAVGLPSFQLMMANQKVRAAADDLVTSVMYARTEAIKLNQSVSINRDASGWDKGWTVAAREPRAVALKGIVLTGLTGNALTVGKDGRIGKTYTVLLCDSNGYASARVVTIAFSGMTRVEQGGSCGS